MKFDYVEVIKKSWKVAWQYKILWLFGFFVGGNASFNFSGGSSSSDSDFSTTTTTEAIDTGKLLPNFEEIQGFISEYIIVILIIAAVAIFVGLFFLFARWLSKPALIKLAEKSDEERPTFSKGLAFGRQFLWRYVLVGWLLWIPYILFVIIPVAIFGFFILIDLLDSEISALSVLPFLGLIGLVFIAALLAIPIYILTELSHRSLVLTDTQPRQAISIGWNLFKVEWKKVAALWLISVGLTIAASIALAIPFFILFAVGVLVFFMGFAAIVTSLNPGILIILSLVASIVVLVVIILASLVKGLSGAFFTNYWTYAYIALQKHNTDASESAVKATS